MYLKMFKNVPKVVSVLKLSYVLRKLKKITKFFVEKVKKMGTKSKRIYFQRRIYL